MIVAVILLIFINSEIHACEPCIPINFEETVRIADLIVIGKKAANGPSMKMDHFPDASDWIEIKILDILKGEESEEFIRVNSWNGMCDYGIVIDEKQYIIFLQERTVESEDYQYDAVKFGCSLKTLPVVNDMIQIDEDEISKGEFVKKLNEVIMKE